MKKFAAILLWVNLTLVWMISADAGVPGGPVYGDRLPDGLNATTEQTFRALKHSVEIFEVPLQVVVPPASAFTAVRLTGPGIFSSVAPHVENTEQKYYLSEGDSDPIFPKADRSSDRYVYGLRKIVI